MPSRVLSKHLVQITQHSTSYKPGRRDESTDVTPSAAAASASRALQNDSTSNN